MDNTFASIIQTSDIKYKHAKGMRDVYGKEFHQFHELFLFIGGNAVFTTEHTAVELRPYTLIVIPAVVTRTMPRNQRSSSERSAVMIFPVIIRK